MKIIRGANIPKKHKMAGGAKRRNPCRAAVPEQRSNIKLFLHMNVLRRQTENQ
jgi:hypothetical protein